MRLLVFTHEVRVFINDSVMVIIRELSRGLSVRSGSVMRLFIANENHYR